MPLAPRQLLALAAACGVGGILGWVLWGWALRGDPGQDWMVFYTAARAYFDGNLPLIFDGEKLTAALNLRFAAWLGFTLNLHPWVYPPTFLLLVLPFGLLPPLASLTAFLLIGFIAAMVAGCAYVGRAQPRWLVAASLVLCPAVPLNVMTGQNAFYTTAVLVGGFGLIDRFPLLAGALLGLSSVKPQLALMVPVALLAARRWRAIAGAALSASVLALLSLATFGPEIWRVWLELMSGANQAYSAWLINGRLNGVSVFACASMLGASSTIAGVAQDVAVIIAAAAVYAAFRRRAPGMLQLAALLAATMLAAPHASASDDILLAIAAGLYVCGARHQPLRPAQIMLAAAVWISPLINPPSIFRPGVLTPLLILLFLATVLTESRASATTAASA